METDHSHLPNTRSLKHVVDGVYHVIVCGIQPVAVVPFLYRFAHAVMSHVGLGVDLRIHLVVRTPPIPDLHLVVGIVRPRVEEDDVPRLIGRAGVPFPQIRMDQARLDASTFAFQRSHQPGDDVGDQPGAGPLELGPRAVGLEVLGHDVRHELCEERGPAAVPLGGLRRPAVAGPHVEPKLPRGGHALPVQLDDAAQRRSGSGTRSLISANSQRKKYVAGVSALNFPRASGFGTAAGTVL